MSFPIVPPASRSISSINLILSRSLRLLRSWRRCRCRGGFHQLHAFTKKTQQTPIQNIGVAKKRLREGKIMEKSSGAELAKQLEISQSRGMEAVIKAQLITAVLKATKKEGLTHEELA